MYIHTYVHTCRVRMMDSTHVCTRTDTYKSTRDVRGKVDCTACPLLGTSLLVLVKCKQSTIKNRQLQMYSNKHTTSLPLSHTQ